MNDLSRYAQLAGRWDLALDLPDLPVTRRAEILVDRHLWRLDPLDEALAAIDELESDGPTTLGALLNGQLLYWRMLHTPGRPDDRLDDAREALATAAIDPALAGWAAFWQGVLVENIGGDRIAATVHYTEAATLAPDDRLLGSYVDRHLGFHRYSAGDPAGGVFLLRRSLYARAACGAVPHVAAAQEALAMALPAGDDERDVLLASAITVAEELDLVWLRGQLNAVIGGAA